MAISTGMIIARIDAGIADTKQRIRDVEAEYDYVQKNFYLAAPVKRQEILQKARKLAYEHKRLNERIVDLLYEKQKYVIY